MIAHTTNTAFSAQASTEEREQVFPFIQLVGQKKGKKTLILLILPGVEVRGISCAGSLRVLRVSAQSHFPYIAQGGVTEFCGVGGREWRAH
jgi:hypothetical protein